MTVLVVKLLIFPTGQEDNGAALALFDAVPIPGKQLRGHPKEGGGKHRRPFPKTLGKRNRTVVGKIGKCTLQKN